MLGTPPALILSQDQTLHKNIMELMIKLSTFADDLTIGCEPNRAESLGSDVVINLFVQPFLDDQWSWYHETH